jgi:hypothetical protein
MQIPLLRGRNFTDQEMNEVKSVIIINDAMARKHFVGDDPIGKRIVVEMSDKPVPTELSASSETSDTTALSTRRSRRFTSLPLT